MYIVTSQQTHLRCRLWLEQNGCLTSIGQRRSCIVAPWMNRLGKNCTWSTWSSTKSSSCHHRSFSQKVVLGLAWFCPLLDLTLRLWLGHLSYLFKPPVWGSVHLHLNQQWSRCDQSWSSLTSCRRLLHPVLHPVGRPVAVVAVVRQRLGRTLTSWPVILPAALPVLRPGLPCRLPWWKKLMLMLRLWRNLRMKTSMKMSW